jgi:hypothetical protein
MKLESIIFMIIICLAVWGGFLFCIWKNLLNNEDRET